MDRHVSPFCWEPILLVAVFCFGLLFGCFVLLLVSQGFPACQTSFLISDLWVKDCHYRHDERSIGGKKNMVLAQRGLIQSDDTIRDDSIAVRHAMTPLRCCQPGGTTPTASLLPCDRKLICSALLSLLHLTLPGSCYSFSWLSSPLLLLCISSHIFHP